MKGQAMPDRNLERASSWASFGISAALATPFRDDGSVDTEAALAIWRDRVGLELLFSEVVNNGRGKRLAACGRLKPPQPARNAGAIADKAGRHEDARHLKRDHNPPAVRAHHGQRAVHWPLTSISLAARMQPSKRSPLRMGPTPAGVPVITRSPSSRVVNVRSSSRMAAGR